MVKSTHFEIDMNCQEKRMLYYVFSDSHGFSGNMLAVLQQKLPDELIFLGDGELDLLDIKKKYPDLVIHNVRGNCDVASTARLQMVIRCGRKKIFLCHGHTMVVKDSLDTLIDNAFAAEANVVLFGHTHIPYTGFSMAMDIMNPGTIGECQDPTYGILTIDGFRVETKIIHLNSLQKEWTLIRLFDGIEASGSPACQKNGPKKVMCQKTLSYKTKVFTSNGRQFYTTKLWTFCRKNAHFLFVFSVILNFSVCYDFYYVN